MRRISTALLVTLALGTMTFGVGCGARRVTDFTLISTKNTMLVASAEKRDRRVTGEDCTMTLVGVPNMKTAIDDALNKAGPDYDALVDGLAPIVSSGTATIQPVNDMKAAVAKRMAEGG